MSSSSSASLISLSHFFISDLFFFHCYLSAFLHIFTIVSLSIDSSPFKTISLINRVEFLMYYYRLLSFIYYRPLSSLLIVHSVRMLFNWIIFEDFLHFILYACHPSALTYPFSVHFFRISLYYLLPFLHTNHTVIFLLHPLHFSLLCIFYFITCEISYNHSLHFVFLHQSLHFCQHSLRIVAFLTYN